MDFVTLVFPQPAIKVRGGIRGEYVHDVTFENVGSAQEVIEEERGYDEEEAIVHDRGEGVSDNENRTRIRVIYHFDVEGTDVTRLRQATQRFSMVNNLTREMANISTPIENKGPDQQAGPISLQIRNVRESEVMVSFSVIFFQTLPNNSKTTDGLGNPLDYADPMGITALMLEDMLAKGYSLISFEESSIRDNKHCTTAMFKKTLGSAIDLTENLPVASVVNLPPS